MIRLAKPDISEEAIAAVGEVFRSGNLVQGQFVSEFEAQISQYLDVENAVVVSSGSAALHLSLVALGIKAGDEVIVPAFTFPATANVVELVGAKPVFVDINLDDYCINTALIEEAITERTVAIMPVHEFGQAAKMDDIIGLCKKHNLRMIEDAACAFGTEYKGRKVGFFGSLGCFSFHPRKSLTTGEGGAIVTDDDTLAAKLRALRNHGMERTEGQIEFKYAGFNYRMTDFQATIGIHQLLDFDQQIEQRRSLALLYDKALEGIEWIKTPKAFADRKMTYQTYHLLISESIDRNDLMKYLLENGVQSNYGAQAVHLQKYYQQRYDINPEKYLNAKKAFKQGLALPIGSHVSKEDIEKVTVILKQYND